MSRLRRILRRHPGGASFALVCLVVEAALALLWLWDPNYYNRAEPALYLVGGAMVASGLPSLWDLFRGEDGQRTAIRTLLIEFGNRRLLFHPECGRKGPETLASVTAMRDATTRALTDLGEDGRGVAHLERARRLLMDYHSWVEERGGEFDAAWEDPQPLRTLRTRLGQELTALTRQYGLRLPFDLHAALVDEGDVRSGDLTER